MAALTFIYSRVSTVDQNVEQQSKKLSQSYPTAQVFEDKFTGKEIDRPALNALRAKVRAGDTVVVYDVSRLGRNAKDVLVLAEEFKTQGVKLIVSTLGDLDIASPAGKMILTTLSGVAEMMRTEMLEKQAIGIATAKDAGKYTGRKQSQETIDKCEKALALMTEKQLTKEQAAQLAGVGVATLYRYIKKQDKK